MLLLKAESFQGRTAGGTYKATMTMNRAIKYTKSRVNNLGKWRPSVERKTLVDLIELFYTDFLRINTSKIYTPTLGPSDYSVEVPIKIERRMKLRWFINLSSWKIPILMS